MSWSKQNRARLDPIVSWRRPTARNLLIRCWPPAAVGDAMDEQGGWVHIIPQEFATSESANHRDPVRAAARRLP